MAQPSTSDLLAPFDPTGYSTISGAQLLQLVSGLSPNVNDGFNLITIDVAGVPVVPAANTTTKWQRYLWIRVLAGSVSLYVWNPSATPDPTFLNWQGVNIAGIAAASILGFMIAANTITDANIANLSYSKLIGQPLALPPNGPAGGVLTGTYPNPSAAAGAITGAMIAAATVQASNLLGSGTAAQMLRVNSSSTTVVEWFTPPAIVTSIVETSIATSQLGSVLVNPAGNGYILNPHSVLQVVRNSTLAIVPTSGSQLANSTSAPANNAVGMTAAYNSGAVTMISNTLTRVLVEVDALVWCNAMAIFVGLYNVQIGTNANAPLAGQGMYDIGATFGSLRNIRFSYLSGVGVANATYYVGFGTTVGTAYLNSYDGTHNPFTIAQSSIKVTEIIP